MVKSRHRRQLKHRTNRHRTTLPHRYTLPHWTSSRIRQAKKSCSSLEGSLPSQRCKQTRRCPSTSKRTILLGLCLRDKIFLVQKMQAAKVSSMELPLLRCSLTQMLWLTIGWKAHRKKTLSQKQMSSATSSRTTLKASEVFDLRSMATSDRSLVPCIDEESTSLKRVSLTVSSCKCWSSMAKT